MARYNVNRNTHLAVRLLELRHHINRCTVCRAAIKARDMTLMCDQTPTMILEIASRWDRNIPGRLAAANGKDAYLYPCPDLNAHGPAYAATAEPCIVTTVVDRLL